ncbi:pentatricopeptide repeat-containing protein At2g03880, mitochondrial [Actinidia eriantha]|uniref:pentatricopeptide repeat-containing protein At2g03880, mitochondrial n=1 Tax=Actinidia eriantha TaxID=165200 RepID=UPI00258A3323|nr:pentatricopeptide repeat-containing protein At2g03880, mitochondrial [Actinidia eriantha]XP_057496344.1 pentatricopeptide repeat-containing protein At2g03880, mitochondrial [Actinidia eriantha]XP_057496346.1 pentatricopeptide repeat-containing protein At2g03880, mitochondrial [Actinidia eriantha]XP_057496347.1 pentatricopeptide repeat-containing protein At2g03880, mitochondrial [Actinidia eriantha]XP_057496348.1 pentatricopeptide repeat-containing protein At2g03880, mitochondrial [Actinidia 
MYRFRLQELSLLRYKKLCCYFHSSFNSVGNVPRIYELNKTLNWLWKSGQIDEARKVFDEMSERDEFTWNTMVAAYAQSGRLTEAKQVFDETPKKCSITWSSLISGFCRYGCENQAFYLFWQMQHEGHKPSQFTLGSLLRMCSSNSLLSRGEQIHAYAVKTHCNAFVSTGLVDMYAKCNCILEAEYIFYAMSTRRSHVLWTAMITGYSQNNDGLRAIKCFRDMNTEGVEFNQYTFPSVLTACAAVSACSFGEQVHSCIVRTGFAANAFVESALVDMYAKCGDLKSARRALETMDIDNVISWNAMLVGCVRQGIEEEALLLFKKMHARGMDIDDFTYPSVLNSCASVKDMENAKSVHCLIVKTGFEAYKLVSNALVDVYAKGGELHSAFEVFNCMIERDVISWTSLVTGYAYNGSCEEALKLFCQMRLAGVDPDQIVIASILSACAELTVLEFGQQVHANFMKSGLESTLSVDNSIVTMYAKCGCIEDANRVFNSMRIWNVITWTALIIGYAQNGKGKDSLALYNKMIATGTKPDFITFIGLLFACSHAGLVEQACHYFESMDKVYGIKPGPDHYACMIDLMGRSGKMNEARELLNQMDVEPDATVWKALLSACRVHQNLELAERAAKALFVLEPQNAMPYVMLSNIYSAAGFWEDAAKLRRLMKSRGISKEPGCSWIEMNSKVHTFMSEDRSHSTTDQIYSKIDEIMIMIKEAGYVPDMNFALHDVDEEGKQLGLAYHSEKLAVAFALLFVPQRAPIRIYKNLRVCGDCHTAMKYISEVFHRHIILRDSNCFHHFREGKCSCGDYW